jgi:predicted permease
VLTLGLSLGATGTIFALVQGILLKPLPFDQSSALVAVRQSAPGLRMPVLGMSPATYFTYRDLSRSFEELGLWDSSSVTLSSPDESERIEVLSVTEGFLKTLRMQTVLGRRFTAADDSQAAPRRAVISHGFWTRRMGQSPDVLGRLLTIDGQPVEIIGVLPAHFTFLNKHPTLLLPFRFNRSNVVVGSFRYNGIARLRAGTTIEAAWTELASLTPLVIERFPMSPGFSRESFDEMRLAPSITPLLEDLTGSVSHALLALLACVAAVAVIAFLNIAQLGVARSDDQARNSALRLSLGANRFRIGADTLWESALLTCAATILALAITAAATITLRRTSSAFLPRLPELSIDPMVLLFILGGAVIAFLLIAMPGALRQWTTDPLSFGSRTVGVSAARQSLHRSLITIEIAAVIVVVTFTCLVARTFIALNVVHVGLAEPDHLLTFQLSMPQTIVKDSQAVIAQYRSIVEQLQSLPSVTSVALTNAIAMDGVAVKNVAYVDGFPGEEGRFLRRFKWISGDYFETVGQQLIAGRALTWQDCLHALPVAIVSANFAREYWGEPAAAVGRTLRHGPKGTPRTIVGVVSDVRDDGPAHPAPTVAYWPLLTVDDESGEFRASRNVVFVLHTRQSASGDIVSKARRAVAAVNPMVAIANARTVAALQRASMSQQRLLVIILSFAAATTLTLGLIGVYSVVAMSVSRRISEIGLRVAVGATKYDVLRLFLRESIGLAGRGIAFGLGAALLALTVWSTSLPEFGKVDFWTFAIPISIVAVMALAATYIPARRASRLDSTLALRAQG